MTGGRFSASRVYVHTVDAGGAMIWYDVGFIRLKYLVDGINNLGLVKKLDLKVKVCVNRSTKFDVLPIWTEKRWTLLISEVPIGTSIEMCDHRMSHQTSQNLCGQDHS